MKTLHIFNTIDPASGGPIEAFLRFGKILVEQGIACDVVSLDQPDSGFDKDFPFPVTLLGESTGMMGKLMGGDVFAYSSKLAPWLRERAGDYQCVTTHNMWTYSTTGAYQGLKGSKTPYLVFVHGMMDPWFRDTYPLKHLKKQMFWSLALGRAMEGATRVLFTAEDERRLAEGMFMGHNGYRAEVIAFGTADVPPYDPAQVEAFHAACPGVQRRPFILFLSRIHPKKGCDLLIEAFGALAAEAPDLQLVMAGPDQTGWRPELEALAAKLGVADRIHWPGMISGDVKWGAFRAAELFALSSHQENFGVAVAEALACGLPVLITKRINIWREIVDGGAGLAGEDNVGDTTASLRHLLEIGADGRKAMGEKARALFLDKFEVSKTALDLARLIREVAA